MNSYLQELTIRLALGADRFDDSFRETHRVWLLAQQKPDGGFGGREGGSDPYYTAFALRALWILQGLDADVGTRAGLFLRQRLSAKDSVIDLVSLIFAAAILEMAVGEVVIDDDNMTWKDNVAGLMTQLRTDDGGFAKTPEGRAGSTYQTFLSVLCYELMEIPVPDPDAVLKFLESQRQVGGGYLEIRVGKRAGVNPTAAAIGTLKAMGQLCAGEHEDTAEFLLEMQSDEGGLTANTRIPFADLLSSFTGTLTLADLGVADQLDLARLTDYAKAMQHTDGGFIGFTLDQIADVEYSFYGVALLALSETI